MLKEVLLGSCECCLALLLPHIWPGSTEDRTCDRSEVLPIVAKEGGHFGQRRLCDHGAVRARRPQAPCDNHQQVSRGGSGSCPVVSGSKQQPQQAGVRKRSASIAASITRR